MELILALKSAAAEILQTIPTSRRNKNELTELLTNWVTSTNGRQTRQRFAMEVERLVQLTHPGENHPLIDNIKTEALRSDIKLAVCSTQKTSSAETVAFALAQETARTITRQVVSKVRTMEVAQGGECLLAKVKDMVKQALEENGQKSKSKWFNCGKGGNFQRNCKAPRKR